MASARSVEVPGRSRPWQLARTLILPVLLLALGAVGTLGYLYWLDQTFYVSTDNAQVTGPISQIASPTAGQVRAVLVEVGDLVTRSQVVAIIAGTGPGGVTQLQLRAPLDGVVVTVNAVPGDVAAAGRPIVGVVDPGSLYVQAHIDETRVARVRPGQPVEVSIDSLGTVLPGRVIAVGQASNAAISPGPSANPSAYFVKVPQLVPVRIDVAYSGRSLLAGGSAVVRIRVQD